MPSLKQRLWNGSRPAVPAQPSADSPASDDDLVPRGRVVSKRNVTILVPLNDWKTLRLAAAFRRLPITELCLQWMEPHLAELRTNGVPMECEVTQ